MAGGVEERQVKQDSKALKTALALPVSATKLLVMAISTIVTLAHPALAQESNSRCESMSYENKNQVDYGPLELDAVRGTATDVDGVMVPGACVGIFTPTDHKLIMATRTDDRGQFEFGDVADGEYRLVATFEGFCAGNAKIRVVAGSRNKKYLDLHVRPAGIDESSYFELR